MSGHNLSTSRELRPTALLRRWPWRASVVAWLVVAGLFTAARRSVTGVEGFSSSNWGWLAFTAVGGAVLAWRLAGRPPLHVALVRPLVVGAVALVLCTLAEALMGVVFLPSHPLRGAGSTVGPLGGALHPLVRSQTVPMIVVPVGYVCELGRSVARLSRGCARR